MEFYSVRFMFILILLFVAMVSSQVHTKIVLISASQLDLAFAMEDFTCNMKFSHW